jgi:hypothetical protein
MEFLAVFVYGFECIQAGFNAGKRVIVFETRENTRGARKYTRHTKKRPMRCYRFRT